MHCRRRRIKCTGGNPCASCVKLNRSCVYVCGPKKPRISHKGVITTLRAENQRLRADLQGLRMYSGLAGVSLNSMSTAGAVPKAEELPFVDAYFAFEDDGLFSIVGRERFADVLSCLRTKKSGRGAASAMPSMSPESTALYFAMLAVGASLRRQEVPAMSYATRVRTVLAETFDTPSETMVRVALLMAIMHGARLEVAKEAYYLSTALQMLALLHRVTGRAAPNALVATAGAICSIADGPLPFTTPKDLECDDPLVTLACLITQVAGVLMQVGSGHEQQQQQQQTPDGEGDGDGGGDGGVDYAELEAACAKAAGQIADLDATATHVPAVHRALVHGLHAITLFHLGRCDEARTALSGCLYVEAPSWAHPVMAFVLRHVTVLSSTLGLNGCARAGTAVHEIAMAWPRAALYFRGLQADLRDFDMALRASLTRTTATAAGEVAPGGGSPSLHATLGMDMCLDDMCLRLDVGSCFPASAGGVAAAAAAAAGSSAPGPKLASVEDTKKVFSHAQMVILALGKPFNTSPVVLAAAAAPTCTLVGAGAGGGAATPHGGVASSSSCDDDVATDDDGFRASARPASPSSFYSSSSSSSSSAASAASAAPSRTHTHTRAGLRSGSRHRARSSSSNSTLSSSRCGSSEARPTRRRRLNPTAASTVASTTVSSAPPHHTVAGLGLDMALCASGAIAGAIAGAAVPLPSLNPAASPASSSAAAFPAPHALFHEQVPSGELVVDGALGLPPSWDMPAAVAMPVPPLQLGEDACAPVKVEPFTDVGAMDLGVGAMCGSELQDLLNTLDGSDLVPVSLP